MDPNPTGIFPKKVTFKAADGSSKEATGANKKKQTTKPKAIEKEVPRKTVSTKSGQGILKKTPKSFYEKYISIGSQKVIEKVPKKVTEEVSTQECENPSHIVFPTKPNKIQLNVTKGGVMIKGVSTPDSPDTKKRKALEFVHRLKKLKPFTVETPIMNVTVEHDYATEAIVDAL
ncbi:unnamed protein product [Lactuca saligna]|uniref:Uncharacterized protein n=1 Tax=Lactuca saligna TaxID=75948 RepID=A0AA35ZI83_LACSI|nr:unnamed protein product [Lactuca saligna]